MTSDTENPTQNLKSSFLLNLIRNQTVTPEEAELLNGLLTPHQQFEAVQRHRARPGSTLREIVNELQAERRQNQWPSFNRQGSPTHKKKSRKIGFPWKTSLALIVLIAGGVAAWKTYRAVLFPWENESPVVAAVPATHATSWPKPFQSFHKASDKPVAATVSTPDVQTPVAAVRPEAPTHLVVHASSGTLVHVTWQSTGDQDTYRIYSALEQNMANPKLEGESPVTWFNWAAPVDRSALWLAVSRVLPDGKESGLSVPASAETP